MQVIVKNYEHFNRSLPNWDTPKGVYVRSKAHYERLCQEANMVPASQTKTVTRKEYSLSKEAQSIIASAQIRADGKGRVQLSDRTIAAMIKKRAIGKKIPSYMQLPSVYTKGGFYAS